MKTIVWDVDDVLNDFMFMWFECFWKPKKIDCYTNYSGLNKNPPNDILGITLKEYLDSIDLFRSSDIYREMKPIEEVMRWLKRYGSRCRHLALTAVPLKVAQYSSYWVLKNYGKWIRSFNFVPSKREGEDIKYYDKGKADFLRWLGNADILIDDNEDNIKIAEKIGIKGILFPRLWNTSKKTITETLGLLGKVI